MGGLMRYAIGIDIGSTCAKTVVLDEQRQIVYTDVQPTGWSSADTAAQIAEKLNCAGYAAENCPAVATGYGRVCVPYAKKTVTEITCHGKGAVFLHGADALTVIDIGGQDTKVIHVSDGVVDDFLMNDRCSAGTGRFLEVMANTLGMAPDDLCRLSAQGGGTTISSLCTVFAESEVTGLIGRGEPRKNIAFAVVDSIAEKVASQVGKLSAPSQSLCLTGGLCGCRELVEALERKLNCPIQTHPQGRFAGAIGAALTALAIKEEA